MSHSHLSVAVLIAAYNAERTIARSVRSALADAAVSEVVVVDDASSDATAALAEACDDGSGRLQVLRQEANGGPSRARNRAIAATESPWLAVLDADDYIQPGRMGRLLAFADEGWDFVADDLYQVDEGFEDAPPRTLWYGPDGGDMRFDLTAFVRANFTRPGEQRRELGFVKPLMSRAFLKRNGIAYRDELRLGEDYDLYIRALAAGARFRLVSAQGYVSVCRPKSLSGRHTIEDLLRLREVDTRLMADFPLTPKEIAALRQHRIVTDKKLQWRILIEAVKQRDVRASLAAFMRGPQVSGYLLAQLAEQAILRGRKRLQGEAARA